MSVGRLRMVEVQDLKQILQWRNHPEIRRYMYTTHEISLDEHCNWFEDARKNEAVNLFIYENDNKPLGFVNITRGRYSGLADWGFYIAPGSPRGTGQDLGRKALECAFLDLKLHKLCGEVVGFNDKSIKFHKSLGFSEEGRLRDQYFDGLDYHDIVCFGLLEREWKLISKGEPL